MTFFRYNFSMSSRLISAVSVSMVVHAGLWSGLFFNTPPPEGRSQKAILENSIFIDPAAFEAVKKARAATVKNKATVAPKLPSAAPKKTAPPPPLPDAAAMIRRIQEKNEAKAETAASIEKPSAKSAPASAARSAAKAAPGAKSAPAASKTGADLMANPKTRGLFTDYFGSVKARIQQKLREKCEGRSIGRGSVQLSFVLTSEGRLHKVYVMDRNSAADGELKELAIESLRESAPFTDFPTDFNARQIAFNLTVYFDELSA